MYSISNNVDNTIIIKKSKFITKLYKINTINDIDDILNKLKKENNGATHICYAYIFNGIEKCSDDGEPSGTAGLPILNVLKRNNLNNILGVVIRYFGGIKLGAGGLVRAYSNSISESIKLTTINELIDGYNITIFFNYDNIKEIDSLLNNAEIIEKKFFNEISYNINISIIDYKNIYNNLSSKCNNIIINENIYITKK